MPGGAFELPYGLVLLTRTDQCAGGAVGRMVR